MIQLHSPVLGGVLGNRLWDAVICMQVVFPELGTGELSRRKSWTEVQLQQRSELIPQGLWSWAGPLRPWNPCTGPWWDGVASAEGAWPWARLPVLPLAVRPQSQPSSTGAPLVRSWGHTAPSTSGWGNSCILTNHPLLIRCCVVGQL